MRFSLTTAVLACMLLGCAHSASFRVVDACTASPIADASVLHQAATVYCAVPASLPRPLGEDVTDLDGRVTLRDHDADRTLFGLYRGMDRFRITKPGYEPVEVHPFLWLFAQAKSANEEPRVLMRSRNGAFTVHLLRCENLEPPSTRVALPGGTAPGLGPETGRASLQAPSSFPLAVSGNQ